MLNANHNRTQTIARWISRLGHPFVLPLVALLVVMLEFAPPQQALGIVAVAAATITLPLLVYTRWQVRSQRWTDYDVSVREHRYRLYPLTLILLAVSVACFWWLDGPPLILQGLAACTVLAFIAMLINRVSKISLHAALSMFCAIAMLMLNLWLGVAACIFVASIGWSRVVLRRHTLFEVICGVLLGGIVGSVLAWIS